jgi:hypothetical protein
MPARSPLTAYGNVRVGPTAMSFVHSMYFSDNISADRHTNQLRQKKTSANFKCHFRPNRRGCFFRAKAQKKSAPDGSAKA